MRVIDLCGRLRINNLEVDYSQMLLNDSGSSWRVRDNNQFQLYNQTTAAYYTLFVTGNHGAESLAIGPADSTVLTITGYMKKNPTGGGWRINNANQFQLPNPTTGSWYALFVSGAFGFEALTIGPADDSVSYQCGYIEMNPVNGTWRIKNGYFQIPNPSTSLWHTIFISGVAGTETPTIGAGET